MLKFVLMLVLKFFVFLDWNINGLKLFDRVVVVNEVLGNVELLMLLDLNLVLYVV